MVSYDYTDIIKQMQEEDSNKAIRLLKPEYEPEALHDSVMESYAEIIKRLSQQHNTAEINYQIMKKKESRQKHMSNPLHFPLKF